MKRLLLLILIVTWVSCAALAADPPAPAVTWQTPIAPGGRSMSLTPETIGKYNIVDADGQKFLWVDPATGLPWIYRLEIKIALLPIGPQPPPPTALIESFTATPDSIKKGQPSLLAWKCTKAKTVTLNSVTVGLTGTQAVTPDATTTFTLIAADGAKSETAQRIVTVTDLPPPPPPIPGPGLHVLIVEEKTDRAKLSKGQQEILTATGPGSVIDYMMRSCLQTKLPNGVVDPGWKIVDKDPSFNLAGDVWKRARAKFDEMKQPVPGWLIFNDVGGEAGPLPPTPAAALEVLKRWTLQGGKP